MHYISCIFLEMMNVVRLFGLVTTKLLLNEMLTKDIALGEWLTLIYLSDHSGVCNEVVLIADFTGSLKLCTAEINHIIKMTMTMKKSLLHLEAQTPTIWSWKINILLFSSFRLHLKKNQQFWDLRNKT